MTVELIDISHHQSTTPGLSGLGGVIARVCYGSGRDTMFTVHAAAVRARNLLLGAYCFGRNPIYSGDPIRAQVATFLRVGGDADFWALDVEKDGSLPRMSNAQAREFIDRVQQTGRDPGLYMSEAVFQQTLGQAWNWVANWSREPGIPYRFWQYHGGPIDRNRFPGTLAQLRALVTKTPEPPEVVTVPTIIYQRKATPGVFTIKAGTRPRAWRPDPKSVTGWVVEKTWNAQTTDSSAPFVAFLSRIGTVGTPSSLLEVQEGWAKGLFVATSEVEERFDPVNVPVDPEDYLPMTNAAYDAGLAAAGVAIDALPRKAQPIVVPSMAARRERGEELEESELNEPDYEEGTKP
jgi:hypothetical protein